MSDRRYSTALWQKLRRAVLAHYGYVCHFEGPRCTGYATTIHHLIPSSQAPHLFWEPSTLVAACRRSNYGDGSRIAAETGGRSSNSRHHRRAATADRADGREARSLRRPGCEAPHAGDPLAVSGRRSRRLGVRRSGLLWTKTLAVSSVSKVSQGSQTELRPGHA
jgi:hypothetical protein